MADFVAVLKKTIDGLDEANADVRRKVYDKARTTIAAKLDQISPPPPPAVAERQKKALEDAIEKVEAEYSAAETGGKEPPDELEAIFASLSEPKPGTAPRPLEPIFQARPKSAVPPPAAPKPAVPHPAGLNPVSPSSVSPSPVSPGPTGPEPAALANRAPKNPATAMPSALSGKPAAAPQKPAPSAPDPDTFFLEPGENTFSGEIAPPPPVRRRGRGLLIALLVLIVLAGAAYGAWFKRADIATALGVPLPEFARVTQPAPTKVAKTTPTPAPKKPAAAKPAAAPPAKDKDEDDKQADAPTPPPAAPAKFTQRLAADGTESNPGPASGETRVGEGTSVAAATPAESGTPAGQETPAATAAGGDKAAVPVAQRAIFYEERTNTEQGSANTGTVVWSLVKESPGGDLPPEPAIRGEATIPSKNLQLRITIRRNGDKTLPASHIVELIFLTPDNFEGGGIDSVLRMAMKDSEQAPGSPIIGIPAKIADGYFLLALNDGKAEVATNTTLLRRESWIDIPVVYKSGRRALMTLEKGVPGDKVFDDVLNAWDQTPIGEDQTPAPAGGDTNKPASASGTGG